MLMRRRMMLADAGHVATASGNPLTVNALAKPLESCVVNFNPVQPGSGDPSYTNIRPISGWAGVNLYISPTQSAGDGTDYPVSWSAHGIKYGGYVDVINGILTETDVVFTFDGTESGWSRTTPTSDSGRYMIWLDSITGIAQYGAGASTKCSHLKYGGTVSKTYGAYRYNPNSGGRTYFSVQDPYVEHFPTLNDFKAYLAAQYANGTPLQLQTALVTPVTYQLSGQNIRTLRGTNHIWSDANDDIAIQYWAK